MRSSRPLADRTDVSVGPIRIRGHRRSAAPCVCEPTEHTVAADLTWEGFGPADPGAEPDSPAGCEGHLDTQRFAQLGSWNGTLEVDGQSPHGRSGYDLGLPRSVLGREAIGEKEPDGHLPGILADAAGWARYFPMRFDDHCIFYICNESPDGMPHASSWLSVCGSTGASSTSAGTDHIISFSASVERLLDRLDDLVPRRWFRGGGRPPFWRTILASAPATGLKPDCVTACTKGPTRWCKGSSTKWTRSLASAPGLLWTTPADQL